MISISLKFSSGTNEEYGETNDLWMSSLDAGHEIGPQPGY